MVRRYRRQSRRPRRTYRRRLGSRYKKRRNLSGNNKQYFFTRYAQKDTMTCTTAVPTFKVLIFRLDQVVNYGEFTALYDMYKINAVKVSFLPQMTQNVSLSQFNNPNAGARFFSAIDRNDGAGVTSMDTLREYKSCKWTPVLRPHKRYVIKPKILDRGGTYNPGNPWVNCDAPSQDYYSLKCGVEAFDSTNIETMTYTIEVKYYLAFKNVK